MQACEWISGRAECVDGFCRKWMYPFPPPPKKKPNMTMENPPVEDVLLYFLLKMGIFQCHVSFQGCSNTVLMEEIRQHLGQKTLEIMGQTTSTYQLVQDFFPQQ